MMNVWRNICGILDRIVYKFVEWLLQVIIDLSNVEIFSQSVLNDFARRIYIILGLIMVFKIMISFIQILINPEKMSDKEQGVGNILIRVVKALLMIVFVPMIFKTARLAQNYVIPVIPKVVLGVTINPSTDGKASELIASVGQKMAFYSFLPFFNYDNTGCYDGSILGTGTQSETLTTVPEIYSVGTAIDHVNDKDSCSISKDGYKYNYSWLISTFVGAYLVYVLVSIAVSIAIRTLKFAVCEFAAPIPIASYVDPKTSKQTFDTWVSTTWKIYLDLFIRLIIVYFIVFVFNAIFGSDGNLSIIYAKLNNDWWRCTLVTLFLIVGLLQFAKSAPKFIGDMLGLKGSGDFMGMFKGEGWKALGSTVATPVGAVTAGVGNAINAKKSGLTFRQGLGSTIAGATSGLWHGGKAALTGKNAKEVWNASTQTPWKNRNRRIVESGNGLSGMRGWATRQRVKMSDWAQFQDDVSLSEPRLKALNSMHQADSSFTNAVKGRLQKSDVGFRSGESIVIDAMANQIESFVRSAGYQNVEDFLTAPNNQNLTPAMERFINRFELGADGNLARNNNGHASFVRGSHIGYNDFQTIAESMQGTELGGFMGGTYLEQLAAKEIRDDVALNRAVTTAGYDANGNVQRSGINDHLDVRGARANRENVYRQNVPVVGRVENPNDPAHPYLSGNYQEDYVVRSQNGYSAVADPVEEAIREINQGLATDQNAIIRAARDANNNRKPRS